MVRQIKYANGAYTAAFQHLFNAESKVIRVKLEKLKQLMSKYKTATKWNMTPNPNGSETWRCNMCVRDLLDEAGIGGPTYPNGNPGGKDAYTAGAWARTSSKIRGWRILGKDEAPMTGDVVSRARRSRYASGHVGMVYEGSSTRSVLTRVLMGYSGSIPMTGVKRVNYLVQGRTFSAGENSAQINSFGFNSSGGQASGFVFRRYTGH